MEPSFSHSTAIVHSSVADKFLQLVAAKVNEIKASASPEGIRGLFNAASAQRVDRLISDALSKGARIVAGKHEVVGNIVQPVVLEDVPKEADIYYQETFGPVLSLIRFDDVEEALRIANSSEYGLSSAVYTVRGSVPILLYCGIC
jgi:acyl-CoA reductase-like NAD-dependent aldehyde dehydrogenase